MRAIAIEVVKNLERVKQRMASSEPDSAGSAPSKPADDRST